MHTAISTKTVTHDITYLPYSGLKSVMQGWIQELAREGAQVGKVCIVGRTNLSREQFQMSLIFK